VKALILQESISGGVTVIYDAPRSGSFIPSLLPLPGKSRIVLTSTGAGGEACFLSGGDISFSKFFWGEVANGEDLYDAWKYAWSGIEYACGGQTAYLDDNGDGLGNQRGDGLLARYYRLGSGIILAGDNPLIGSVSPEQMLQGGNTAAVWAENVTTTGTIDRVWALLVASRRSRGRPR
jgi:hypothetical protein